jgi:hypothetical protein
MLQVMLPCWDRVGRALAYNVSELLHVYDDLHQIRKRPRAELRADSSLIYRLRLSPTIYGMGRK